MSFKDLNIGDVFVFLGDFYGVIGMKRGPWRKISARKYEHLYEDMVAQVGTIHVGVTTQKNIVYR